MRATRDHQLRRVSGPILNPSDDVIASTSSRNIRSSEKRKIVMLLATTCKPLNVMDQIEDPVEQIDCFETSA